MLGNSASARMTLSAGVSRALSLAGRRLPSTLFPVPPPSAARPQRMLATACFRGMGLPAPPLLHASRVYALHASGRGSGVWTSPRAVVSASTTMTARGWVGKHDPSPPNSSTRGFRGLGGPTRPGRVGGAPKPKVIPGTPSHQRQPRRPPPSEAAASDAPLHPPPPPPPPPKRESKGKPAAEKAATPVASQKEHPSAAANAAAASPTSEDAALKKLSVAELKELLRARGEKVGGRKAELLERVRNTGGLGNPGRGFSSAVTHPDVAARGTGTTRRGYATAAAAAAVSPSNSPLSAAFNASSYQASINLTKEDSKQNPQRKKPAAPRMVWEVTDPPLPPRAPPLDTVADGTALRVVSWNVNGLRALLDKDPRVLDRLAEEEAADVVLLQETKLQGGAGAGSVCPPPERASVCSSARRGNRP